MTLEERRRARSLAHLGVWSAYPARTRPSAGRWKPAAAALGGVLLLWWAVTAGGLIAPLYLPNPLDVVARMGTQLTTGVAWRYLAPTLGAALLGALIAVAVALPLGVVITHSRLFAAVVEPFVAISQTVPLVAIAPLLVLWIGYGTVPIAVLCAIIAFFPMVTTTVVGLRSLDMRVVENALRFAGPGHRPRGVAPETRRIFDTRVEQFSVPDITHDCDCLLSRQRIISTSN